ncbi:uncharacterized protein [Venturia canescens]|uniref:uncharacterized protein n=1 Tax=Venturia canescens TaxID=32260 RepID=UPI001C9CC566|nr:uncharacterized protein LOC122411336 [Venturia canescens]
MREPQQFTVPQLKAKLQERDLPSTGSKSELIARLEEADPSGDWRKELGIDEMPQSDIITQNTSSHLSPGENNMQREIELLRRERDLMQRELALAQRELELARTSASPQPIETQPKANIRALTELLSDFNGSQDTFTNWEKQLNLIKSSYNLDDDLCRILVGSKLKGKALEWFHSKPEHIEMSLDQFLQEMQTMFDHRPNKVALRRQFENRRWKNGETFNDYHHQKIILANRVGIAEDEIVDYIIDGIPDTRLQDQARMQQFGDKMSLLSAFEKISLSSTRNSGKPETNYKGHPRQPSSLSENSSDHRPVRKCFFCDKEGHLKPQCPEFKCFSCDKSGHIARDCPNRPKEVNNVHPAPVEENEFCQTVLYTMYPNEHKETIQLSTLLDTGSAISFIKLRYVPSDAIECTEDHSNKFRGINNSNLVVLGMVTLDIEMNGKIERSLRLMVVPDFTMISCVILGRDVIKRFGLGLKNSENAYEAEIMNIDVSSPVEDEADLLEINPTIPIKTQKEIRQLFREKYLEPERPEEPNVKAEFKLTLTNPQQFRFAPRRLSYAEKERVQEIVNKLLEKGIIRPSESEYASPIVLVKKKNGETRMCVDYRTLNKMTARDNYPLPLIEDQLDILQGKRYFTMLDLKDGFHHISMADESIKYTAFVTPFGQYEYVKMPFGLKGASTNFQRWINQVLKEFINKGDVIAYLDDFMIATETIERNLYVLAAVLATLVANKLELRVDKCKFLFTNITYLGYRVSQEGISPTNDGITAIQNYPVPQDARGVRRFLGMTSYFRKFIEGFSVMAKPLYELCKKDTTFRFGQSELGAFNSLKEKLIQAPILALYNPCDETELHCDGSAQGYGGVLLQRKSDGRFHPVFYFSKLTSDSESKYHSFELETLAIIYALRRFRVYLHGIKFKIVTDCDSLKMTLNKKK